MKLDIPFYSAKTNTDCGATVLKMVVDFLANKEHNYLQLLNLVDSDKSGVTFTLGLAKAAAQLGFVSEFYTKSLEPDPAIYELEYSKQMSDGLEENRKKLKRLRQEATELGAKLHEKTLNLEEILQKFENSQIPIVLVDWSKIDSKIKKAHFHFLPIVGYDADHIYVHTDYNAGTLEVRKVEPRPFLPIPRNQFELARTAFGTDEDIVFISKSVTTLQKPQSINLNISSDSDNHVYDS